MSEKIALALLEVFKSEYLVTLIISMIPMIEVRGAIPIAISMGMSEWVAYFFSCVSALIVCPILVLILRPILDALKKTKAFTKLATAVESTFRSKAEKIENKAEKKTEDGKGKKEFWYKLLGLFLFVAIPLPLTGVWTGTCVAVFLNMKLRHSLPAIVLGNFTAGAIITLLSHLLGDKISIILWVLFAFVIISIVGLVVGLFSKNKKLQSANGAENPTKSDENEKK